MSYDKLVLARKSCRRCIELVNPADPTHAQYDGSEVGPWSPWLASRPTGDVLLVEFTLMGQSFTGLNGGPQFQFNEAISFQIPVDTQAEVDRFADALSAVPAAEQCGWVKDRFGVSW